MTELALLRDFLVISVVALAVVAPLRRLGMPSIAGYILAGILVGPGALGLVADVHDVEVLAEIGVALLLFGIGLELSLERLRRLWRPVVIGGALQVSGTIAVTTGVAAGLGVPLPSAVFLGFLVAVSSTAIVLRALGDRGELQAPHGRLTLGILVFQDLSVVPMLLLVPVLAGTAGSAWQPVIALGKAVGVLVGVLVAASLVVPRFLHIVARTRQRDLFVLAVFLVSLGTAWSVNQAGISLALGAFLAGLVVAGSEYRHQALTDLIPVRDVLTSIFFVSIGMLLQPAQLAEHAVPVLGLLVALLGGKFLIIVAVGAAMRLPLRVSVLAAVGLAEVGEFAFVLMHAAGGTGLLAPEIADIVAGAFILSMLITPLLLAAGPRLAAGAGRIRALTHLLEVRGAHETEAHEPLADHVIIAGYGVTGQELARSLRECGIPYAVVDLNTENVRHALRQGEHAYFGDVTSTDVLVHLGLERARMVVIGINDPNAAVRAIAGVRRIDPELPIVVRARYVADGGPLLEAGATEVVIGEVESAAEVSARVLRSAGVDADTIGDRLAAIRGRWRRWLGDD